MDPLDVFTPRTRRWFEQAFAAPTPAQTLAWPAIASGENVLVQAPTGSGKTLAAFMYGIDRLTESPGRGLRLLFVSPLKALNYDVERNLRGPLAGLESTLRVGVRTGDTPAKERRDMLKSPPDILITTPESLFLLLTSQARESLRTVETLILDEVHAVAGTKRGAHMALSVERLERLLDRPLQRIALSATQRPMEEIGRFVSGGRPIRLVDAGHRKQLDLQVVVPVEDMRELDSTASLSYPVPADGQEMDAGTELGAKSIWPSMYPELLRGQQEEERLGGRDQDVRRVAQHRRALLLRGVARAHADAQLRAQPGKRPAQVPLDVVVERLQRRDIEEAESGAGVRVEPVDPVEEGGERLARAGRRLDEDVLTARDRRPAGRLGRGGSGERLLEPGSRLR